MHLDQRHQLMLENAFYMVSLYILFGPPTRRPHENECFSPLLMQKIVVQPT